MNSGKIYKVFVSSTFEDLREERAVLQKALLQLDCLPVGMELFPAADQDTWQFIKSQIDDADYYVVVVAGRYGSQGPDGISFTEMEYDYAVAQKKPAIGFVHADPGSIAAKKTEVSEEARTKLERFLAKVKQRPVRQFRSPHELALEVTTSFVQLLRDRPAVGYVRTSDAVEFKRYAELLEENRALKERLLSAGQAAVRPLYDKPLAVFLSVGNNRLGAIDCTLKTAFRAVGEGMLQSRSTFAISSSGAHELVRLTKRQLPEGVILANVSISEGSWNVLRREFSLYGLIATGTERTTGQWPIDFEVWTLTDFGQRELAALEIEAQTSNGAG